MSKWYAVFIQYGPGTKIWIQASLSSELCFATLKPMAHRSLARSSRWKYAVSVIIAADFIGPVTLSTIPAVDCRPEFEPYIPAVIFPLASRTIGYTLIPLLAIPLAIQMITSAIILTRVAKLQTTQRARTLKIARPLILTLLMYYTCWIPYTVLIIWEAIPGADPSPWLYTIALNVAIANSSMSFVIYYMTVQSSIKTFHKLIKAYDRPTQGE